MTWFGTKKGIIASVLVLLVATFSIGAVLGGQFKNLFSESIESKDIKGKAFNVLFMGIDSRDNTTNTRSDTMILASIDPKNKKAAILSIPRDTRIKDSKGRSAKINSVNYVNGPEAACEEVAKLLDTDVDYYVITNFAGFGKIVDALGGVDIYVDGPMKHEDVKELRIDLKPGYQHLDGKAALEYVRYRGGPTADIGRTQLQQKFIKALVSEMFKAKTILKLQALIPELYKYTNTNIPLKDMIYMANMAKKFEGATIVAQTLPGYPFTDPATGASYWEADKSKTSTIIKSLLEGKTFEVIGDPPAWMQKQNLPVKPVIPDAEKESDILPGSDPTGTVDPKAEGDKKTDKPNPSDQTGVTGNTKTDPSVTPNDKGDIVSPDPLIPGSGNQGQTDQNNTNINNSSETITP